MLLIHFVVAIEIVAARYVVLNCTVLPLAGCNFRTNSLRQAANASFSQAPNQIELKRSCFTTKNFSFKIRKGFAKFM